MAITEAGARDQNLGGKEGQERGPAVKGTGVAAVCRNSDLCRARGLLEGHCQQCAQQLCTHRGCAGDLQLPEAQEDRKLCLLQRGQLQVSGDSHDGNVPCKASWLLFAIWWGRAGRVQSNKHLWAWGRGTCPVHTTWARCLAGRTVHLGALRQDHTHGAWSPIPSSEAGALGFI